MKSLLKNQSFLIIWIGKGVSELGNTFSSFVMSWLVYTITGSKLAMGSIMVAFLVSRSVSLLWSGPYLDRWNRKYVMVFSEWSRSLTFIFPLVMYLTNSLEVWHLVVVLILTGLTAPLYQPSSMAYIGQVFKKEQLLKANSIIDTTGQVMMFLGPLLSGLLLYVIGIEWILTMLITLLGLSGFALMFLPNVKGEEKAIKEKWFTQLKEGLSGTDPQKLE